MKVTVIKPSDRKFYIARWVDPETGKPRKRSTKCTRRRDAERFAAELEDELKQRNALSVVVTWGHFQERYDTEVLESHADTTREKSLIVLNQFQKFAKLKDLEDISASHVSRWQAFLRKIPNAETTIASKLAHLKSALGWAVDQSMLKSVPKFPKIKRAKKSDRNSPMKGRPITEEEFDRVIDSIENTVGKSHLDSWDFIIRGLWLSGLRVAESMNLWWDREDKLLVLIEREYPMFQIRDELEKGHRDRLLPMAPEFAEFLREVPVEERIGPIFNPSLERQVYERLDSQRVSKTISRIGEAAKVVVHRDGDKVKYASAHDFRRSFGERWAMRVTPAVLQMLMRHETIDTTMRFYVGQNAERIAKEIRAAMPKTAPGPTFGPTSEDSKKKAEDQNQRNMLSKND